MRTDQSGRVYALLAVVLSCAGLGCPASQTTPRASLRPDIGEVPVELRAEYQSFATNCSKCHDLERALAAPVTDTRHWDIYVAKMMRTAGSAIHPDEAKPILRFLYWYTEKKNSRGSISSETPVSAAPPSSFAGSSGSASTPESADAGTPNATSAPASAPSDAGVTEGESNP